MKRKISILAIVMCLIFIVSCTEQPVKGTASSIFEMGNVKNIKITSNSCNVKEGVSNNSKTIDTLNKNEVCDVAGTIEDWYAVKLPTNEVGFVPTNQCTPIVPGKDTDTKPETKPDMMTPDSNVPDNMTDLTPGTTPQTTPGYTPGTTPGTAPGATPGVTPGIDDTTPDTTDRDTYTANSDSLTGQEQEMLNLINEARAQNNVPALKLDMELTNVARIKSQDMIDNNYFSHNSPTYGSPFDMMRDFGIEYVKAGENIAGNRSVQNAHDSLMNSPGHRKNILDPEFTHIGIGIKEGSQYGNIFTQMFISKPQ